MDVDKQIAALQADLNAAHHITYLTGAAFQLRRISLIIVQKMEFTMGFRKAQNKF